jgi:hypothetical protein
MVLQDKFTVEGLIIIALATVPIILLALAEVRRRRPLKMAFDEVPYHAPAQHRLHGSMAIGLGGHNLHVVLRPRTPIHVKSLDIRFVGREVFNWRTAWSPQIRLTKVTIPQWSDRMGGDIAESSFAIVEGQPPGAFSATVRPPQLWTAGEPLHIELTVEAEAPRAGHLSIRCCGERRTYSRKRVTVLQQRRKAKLPPPWRRPQKQAK